MTATRSYDEPRADGARRTPPPRVVLAGRPGAGKGTQGVRLSRRLGVQYLSTGDLLRAEMTMGSPLGTAVERLVNAGRLVPTGLIVAIVETNLNERGYVLDGFPRTVAQAEVLCERTSLAPTVAVEIVVSPPVALDRLLARGRRDDDPAVARERLATYDAETAPALSWLDRRGLLVRVDGHDVPDAVEHNVWRALQWFLRGHNGSARLPTPEADVVLTERFVSDHGSLRRGSIAGTGRTGSSRLRGPRTPPRTQ